MVQNVGKQCVCLVPEIFNGILILIIIMVNSNLNWSWEVKDPPSKALSSHIFGIIETKFARYSDWKKYLIAINWLKFVFDFLAVKQTHQHFPALVDHLVVETVEQQHYSLGNGL